MGLMIGIEMHEPIATLRNKLLKEHKIALEPDHVVDRSSKPGGDMMVAGYGLRVSGCS